MGRVGRRARLQWSHLHLNHQQKRICCVQQPSSRRAQMKQKVPEAVLSKDNCAQVVHGTTLRTKLRVFDDLSTRNVQSGYSIALKFVKNVPQDCMLSWRLPPGLHNESLEQLIKNKSRFLQAPCNDPLHQAPVFLHDQDVQFIQGLDRCQPPAGSWKQWELTVETVRYCGWKLFGSRTTVVDLLLSLYQSQRRKKRVYDPAWVCWLLPNCWKFKTGQMIFFIYQAPFPTLEQIQLLMHGIFWKECTAPSPTDRQMQISILNKVKWSVDREEWKGGMARNVSTSNLLIGHIGKKDHNVWAGNAVQYWTCRPDGWGFW